jgi:hypothetical protein
VPQERELRVLWQAKGTRVRAVRDALAPLVGKDGLRITAVNLDEPCGRCGQLWMATSQLLEPDGSAIYWRCECVARAEREAEAVP